MKLTSIPYNGGTIWVDKKGEIKQGDTVYRFYQDGTSHIGESLPASDNLKRLKDDRVWKVIAQSTNLSILNIPYVEIEEDVPEEAYILANKSIDGGKQLHKSIIGNDRSKAVDFAFDRFLEGYKAALAKKYTEQDLRNTIIDAIGKWDDGKQTAGEVANSIIQSLQPKIKSIEIEMENKTNEDIQIELGIYGHDEGLTEKEYEDYKSKNSILKLVTYQKDGKTFLKVLKVNYE